MTYELTSGIDEKQAVNPCFVSKNFKFALTLRYNLM